MEQLLTDHKTIRPMGFTIDQVRLIMSNSTLCDKCSFVFNNSDVLDLIGGFDFLMDHEEIEFSAESLATIYVAGIMISMLENDNLANTDMQRNLFLKRCFDFMACTEELHVHQVCLQILKLMDINYSANMINLIHCCRHASTLCSMSQIIANCLLWHILYRLIDIEVDLNRMRAYTEILLPISLINPGSYVESYLHNLNLIVRCIGALLLSGPYGNTDRMRKEVGISNEILEFSNEDAAVLFRWLNNIVIELRDKMYTQDNETEERLVVLEITCELMKLVKNQLVRSCNPQSSTTNLATNTAYSEDTEYADGGCATTLPTIYESGYESPPCTMGFSLGSSTLPSTIIEEEEDLQMQ